MKTSPVSEDGNITKPLERTINPRPVPPPPEPPKPDEYKNPMRYWGIKL